MRDHLLADRIRAAACLVLKDADRPLRIAALVAGIRNLGVPIPAPANKTVADLLRTSLKRGHVHRRGRGTYVLGRLPRSTEQAMRRRIASFAAGVRVQPHARHGLTHEEAAAIQQARAAGVPAHVQAKP